MTAVVFKAVGPAPQDQVVFADTANSLDLTPTRFQIRATIERNRDGSVDVVVGRGGRINAQNTDGLKVWKAFHGPARIPLRPGVVMFDPDGRCKVIVDAREA